MPCVPASGSASTDNRNRGAPVRPRMAEQAVSLGAIFHLVTDDWHFRMYPLHETSERSPRPPWSKESDIGADATSASSSARLPPTRAFSSSAAICRAARGSRPPSTTAWKRRCGPRFARAAPGSRWSSTSWRRWPACRSTTARSGSISRKCPAATAPVSPFVEALDAAGVVEQETLRPPTQSSARSIRLGNQRELDRGPALLLGEDRPPVRTGLRQRQSHRPAEPGNLAVAGGFPRRLGPQPHVPAGSTRRRR